MAIDLSWVISKSWLRTTCNFTKASMTHYTVVRGSPKEYRYLHPLGEETELSTRLPSLNTIYCIYTRYVDLPCLQPTLSSPSCDKLQFLETAP